MRNVFLRAKPTRFGSLPLWLHGRLHHPSNVHLGMYCWGVADYQGAGRCWRAIRLDEAVVDCYRYTHYCSEPGHPTVIAGPGSEINFARVRSTRYIAHSPGQPSASRHSAARCHHRVDESTRRMSPPLELGPQHPAPAIYHASRNGPAK
ncbi:hypothetical protein KVR01_011469 [Diaporthe batatas]|uniref:uncharacterized protein n=1 Tax=Diaporthe batatas TaxID=748121 RepID=UPI001D05391F|nr:uncharacterized protein KVR01_011469 [Diaporthe batatas]KAG8159026.1 hypothetical protein KVR01_011469 [Diaporthe batatas]